MSLPKICWCRRFLCMHDQLEGQWNWYAWLGQNGSERNRNSRQNFPDTTYTDKITLIFLPEKMLTYIFTNLQCLLRPLHLKSKSFSHMLDKRAFLLFYPYFTSNMKKFTVDKINYLKDHSNSQEPTDRSTPEIVDHWSHLLLTERVRAWLISFAWHS